MIKKNILAHRGLWKSRDQMNSQDALANALSSGFGVETDIRDLNGEIVISHDPPDIGKRSYLKLTELLKIYTSCSNPGTLALNVKSDGLAPLVEKIVIEFKIRDYFFFDMSVPDTLHYRQLNLPYYARLSEYEQWNFLFKEASGVWLDSFQGIENSTQLNKSLSIAEQNCCVVSPELHGRSHNEFWHWLKTLKLSQIENLQICTDLPCAFEKFWRE